MKKSIVLPSNNIVENNDDLNNIWKIKTSILTSKIIIKIANVFKNDSNYHEARERSKELANDIYNNLLPKYWININVQFWETTKEYVDISNAIKKFIENWTNSELLPLLSLWNHQAYWLEAICNYYFLSNKTKILLKDTLVKIPFIWKSIKSINPIIFNRKWSKKKALRDINKEEKDTIEKNWSIFIYPEWTRSRDWKFNWFNPLLYKWAFEAIKNIKKSMVVIITVDSIDILPDTFEKLLIWLKSIKKWEIKYTIDLLDSNCFNNIRDFNKRASEIVNINLSNT